MIPIGRLCVLGLLCQVRTVWTFRDATHSSHVPPKIAVIGGGIGGTSTAYFLSELFGDNAIIDVYESGETGGRLATIPIVGHNYEIGGSIIHPQNRYMVNFASKFGLKQKKGCKEVRMGLFNGEEYVYRESSWSVLNLAKLVWRYGFDVYRLQRLTDDMLSSFSRIYRLQDEGKAYKDVASMLYAMDPEFPEMTRISSAEWLKGQGFNDLMIDELVTAVTQCNYGQTPSVHAFVGAISVAGADPNLWAVVGGNKLVAEQLLKYSRAGYLRRLVTEVAPNSQGQFTLASVEVETPHDRLYKEGTPSSIPEVESSDMPRTQDYDIVVVATPLTEDKRTFKFVNFTEDFDFPGRYERIICTMVQGRVRPQSLLATEDTMVDEILVTNPRLIFNSFGKQSPVEFTGCPPGLPDVWKIFSPIPLGEEQLNIFFEKRNSTNIIDWLAYPHYDSDQQMGNFELLPGMYHVNAIEWAGSAMEMSIIGAKNAALLAYKYWLQDENAGRKKLGKDEL